MTRIAIASESVPRVGLLAQIRNRRGVVASVQPFDTRGPDGILHLVEVEYFDADGPPSYRVLWQREHGARLVEPSSLPAVDSTQPMRSDEFDALVRTTRWSATTPFLSFDGSRPADGRPVVAPLHGAVQIEDFQLVPLLQALRMPRVSLLIADDVGLGKTVEAGLILSELLVRRRIRRVLVLCPAALRLQWHQELIDKFALPFEVVDRAETQDLRRRIGLEANPWRTYPRIVASYNYLRQPDVLEQFLAVCRLRREDAANLPWDLLVVDEAHNLMPSNFGRDSDLSDMLRLISPYFEHKLFLTATPHNGHTRCFSGLLERLDPVRFTQTSEFTRAERDRVSDVIIRRLKREINELDTTRNRTRRFAERFLAPLPLYFDPLEAGLARAFSEFRSAARSAIIRQKASDVLAGAFALEVLNKRLLSCASTFAESWWRFHHGLEDPEGARTGDVAAARRASEEDLDDDLERESRARHAARVVGAWLRPLAPDLADEISAVDRALERLGLSPQQGDPVRDTRFDRVTGLVDQKLRGGSGWRDDERLVVFTEYKTTLDTLVRRLRTKYSDDGRAVRELYTWVRASWEECARHAELIGRILSGSNGPSPSADDSAPEPAASASGEPVQPGLFGDEPEQMGLFGDTSEEP